MHIFDSVIRRIFLFFFLFSCVSFVNGKEPNDSLCTFNRLIHRIEWDVIPSSIIHTNKYLNGNNDEGRIMNHAFTTRLQYALQEPPGTERAQIYKNSYQGIGLACHDFNQQLGNPISAFLFQGARIKRFSSALSLNYEWNLGLTFGWNPYNYISNKQNMVIGSKITAYIDADFYLNWRLNNKFDLNTGLSATHFSNGNTTIPNAGLNVMGGRVSLAYYFNRQRENYPSVKRIPPFHKHISYDLMAYGAWRKQGIYLQEGPVALPDTYGVVGFSFSPLYNVNHWFNAGLSLDGAYDSSSNLYVEDYTIAYGEEPNDLAHIAHPSAMKQMTLGLSSHFEFVMPYFTINAGIGHNFVNAHGELNGWYESMALKIGVTHNLFLNIGYSLYNFKTPNHLMFGLGWHFHQLRKY